MPSHLASRSWFHNSHADKNTNNEHSMVTLVSNTVSVTEELYHNHAKSKTYLCNFPSKLWDKSGTESCSNIRPVRGHVMFPAPDIVLFNYTTVSVFSSRTHNISWALGTASTLEGIRLDPHISTFSLPFSTLQYNLLKQEIPLQAVKSWKSGSCC